MPPATGFFLALYLLQACKPLDDTVVIQRYIQAGYANSLCTDENLVVHRQPEWLQL
jgi:hypothetical protein